MITTLSLSLALMASSGPAVSTDYPATAADGAGQSPEQALLSMNDYLERATARGVPLFNEGMPEACAAVYATALEAVAVSRGWGIDARRRAELAVLLDFTAAIEDPAEQAWAYRRVIDALLSGAPLNPPATADSLTLFEFSNREEVDRWRVVVDGVMGGRSTGRIEQRDDVLVFSGETSLQNNGGFSSVRAPVPAGSMAGYDALRIRVMGDGRTWIVGASTRSGMRGDSFWTRFDTRDGEWLTITVPIAGMVRQYFGRPIEGRLQPSAVRGLEFYIYDKQAGPFRLQVDRIEAVRVPR